MFGKQVYSGRRLELSRMINDGILLMPGNVDVPMNYPANTYHFRQDSTFLYYFGIDYPGLAAVIDTETGEEIIFGDDIDIEDIIWMGNQPSVSDKAALAGVSRVLPSHKLADVVSGAIQKGRKVHFLPPYRAENKILLQGLLGIKVARLKEYASLPFIRAVVAQRAVKDELEIAEIEKACATGREMHLTAMKLAQPGMWEQNLAGRLEGIAISGGGSLSFPVILSQNGETLHNHDHSQLLKEGRLLLVDAGAETAMRYACDYTRTIPVGGRFTPQQRAVYEIVLAANRKATEMIKPGITYLSVHLAASKVIADGLKNLGLMTGDTDEAVAAGAHALFFPHGLGHMMGLDVHDMEDLGQIHVGYDDDVRPVQQFGTGYLRLGRELQEGFVLTNEPGIYFIPALIEKWKNEKINNQFICFSEVEKYLSFGGIRIEDDILVTAEGAKVLGEPLPASPEEVEAIVRG